MLNDVQEWLPLSEVALEILLELGQGDRHGYAILQGIEDRTEGRVALHAGSLYRALARMLDQGWIEELPGDGPRRRSYRITGVGRQVAEAEVGRLADQVAVARARNLAGG